MDTIIVASTRPYTGKSGIALALFQILKESGSRPAYFKPYGTMPATVDGYHTDLDAAYAARYTGAETALDVICPVVETSAFIEDVVAGRIKDVRDRVRSAYDSIVPTADVLLVEGPSDLYQGRSVGVSLPEVAEQLDGRVILVTPGERSHLPDDVLCVAELLGARLAGVLYNDVHSSVKQFIVDQSIPFLKNRGINVFGCMQHDAELASVTIGEVAEELGGTVLCAENHLGNTAESFMVGAMGQDKALRFFRRRPRKIVITGGDRADVQLAALETETRALVLTGSLPPAGQVLSRAEELGVPMILVDLDTLTAVERLEGLFGRMRVHDPGKAARIREMMEAAVDVDAMFEALMSSRPKPG